MKKFEIGQAVICIALILLFASGLILIEIENKVTQGIGKLLLIAFLINLLISAGYLIGGDTTKADYEKKLADLEEGHIVLHNYQDKKIAEKNAEIKKLKAQNAKLKKRNQELKQTIKDGTVF